MGGSRREDPWAPAKWTLSLLWAGFWGIGGVGTALDPTDGTGFAAGLALAALLGVAPMVPVWWHLVRDARRERAERPARARRPSRAERRAELEARRRAAVHASRLERLPARARDEVLRLDRARSLVQRFADQGWVDESALREVDATAERLERLLAADAETDRLGGAASGRLLDQLVELGDLLVALADEAVEHQATLVGDSAVPATLADARERLAHTRAAYEQLGRTPPRRTVDDVDPQPRQRPSPG